MDHNPTSAGQEFKIPLWAAATFGIIMICQAPFRSGYKAPLAVMTALIFGALMVFSPQSQAHHVQRVIVEHHYPQGVTKHYGHNGRSHITHRGYYNPSTCYRACYDQGRSYGYRNAPRYNNRHRSSVQFGMSAGGHGNNGFQTFSFGFSQHR